MTDAGKLAHRLPRDRRERAGWEIREAVGVTEQTRDCTQRHIVRHLLPAQGLGVPCAPGINDRRVTHNMCCVIVPEASCMTTEPRSSRDFVGASGLVAWHRRASAMTKPLTLRQISVTE